MDLRKKQSEQSLPLAESGVATASPSVTESALGTKNARHDVRIVAANAIRSMQMTHNVTANSARPTIGPILKVNALRGKTGSSLLTEYPASGTMPNSQSKAASAQSAALTSQMDAANFSISTIGIAAVKSALAAASVFVAYCVCAVTLLLSAWNPIEIGQKRLSPILEGTHE
jgi:hypothetical protein